MDRTRSPHQLRLRPLARALQPRKTAVERCTGEDRPILNIASVWGRGYGSNIAYMVLNAALIAATKHTAVSVAKHGVLVNSAAPGMIATPDGMWENLSREHSDGTLRKFLRSDPPYATVRLAGAGRQLDRIPLLGLRWNDHWCLYPCRRRPRSHNDISVNYPSPTAGTAPRQLCVSEYLDSQEIVWRANRVLCRAVSENAIRVCTTPEFSSAMIGCAVVRWSLRIEHPIWGFIERGKTKDHGTQKRYDGYDIIPGRTLFV